MQEKRAQEDHIHVTEMHNLILQSLQNQHGEIEELKQLLSVLNGQVYTPQPAYPLPDLRDLHPRGDQRYEIDEHQQRFENQLSRNALVTTLRKDLKTGLRHMNTR